MHFNTNFCASTILYFKMKKLHLTNNISSQPDKQTEYLGADSSKI